jgi:hypothetical protein
VQWADFNSLEAERRRPFFLKGGVLNSLPEEAKKILIH